MPLFGASPIDPWREPESSENQEFCQDGLHPSAPPASLAMDWPSTACLGRTCLKWGNDDELTSVALLLVLAHLA